MRRREEEDLFEVEKRIKAFFELGVEGFQSWESHYSYHKLVSREKDILV